MQTSRNEAGDGQSYPHRHNDGSDPLLGKQTVGVHLLLLLVTMLDHKTATIKRSDEGLGMDNRFL